MATINNELETLASDILLKNDMLKLPVDLVEMASQNNVDVYSSKLPEGISGAIKYNEEINKFEILIDRDETSDRQRFTLAHELAHYFLQGESLLKNKNIHFDTLYRRNKNPEEQDVEYLAAALLMEKNMLTHLYEVNSSISALSEIFKVSESTMTNRLMTLDLI